MNSISQAQHWKNFRPLAIFFLILSFCLRTTFLIWSRDFSSVLSVIESYFVGLLFDIAALLYIAIPWVVVGLLIPPLKNTQRLRTIYLRSIFVLTVLLMIYFLFVSIGEITFWNEFHSRFNFIAVDYLVYTSEVLKNIWESYPVGWLLVLIAGASLGLSVYFYRFYRSNVVRGAGLGQRAAAIVAILALVSVDYFVFPSDISKGLESYALHEVSKNGIHSLFSAYLHNELYYDHFYKTLEIETAFKNVRNNLQEDGKLAAETQSITREISSPGKFHKYNVILVSMESMSARFMNSFGSKQNITPNLDDLASKGLFFTNLFATGTRTVRGLEALSLSIPPTPGQSIVRRPNNDNLFNIGDYFYDTGYTTEFLYGGHGYFDNMNAFFSSNKFTIWDQGSLSKEQITFANAWGVCDEDLFNLSIRRADASFEQSKPFFQLIMTTSNHRPYTYPQKIDIPSGKGREGAIKYSDFSIGEFIKAAEKKPWFKDTIFIFVADHDAAVAGNVDIPVADFRIPLIMYAPSIISPQKVTKMASQIDVAPTVLGLLSADYESHFFGHDIMRTKSERAFLATYQKVGLLKDGVLTLLGPNKKVDQYSVDEKDQETRMTALRDDLVSETISYYQVASFLFRNGHMKDNGDDKIVNTLNR